MNPLGINGSAVLAMRGKDCVAIATDMRLGMQFKTISTDFPKVFQFGSRLFVGFPGLATDTLTVSQMFDFRKNMYELRENRPLKPRVALSMLSNLLYSRRFGPYFVEPVVAGIDPVTMEPFVGTMDLIGCANEANDFSLSGTCTEQLFGMCETMWEKDMSPDALFECISQCMLNALDRDCSSGWGVRVFLITQDQVTISDLKARMD
ncbi:Proteasome subunit beta type-3 [Cichlidogyrus casuarinus]|uniref:Proteasome subunit beta n=1 Tax=Cichlidogyrus casuarinus TaxID=1844966 RepID=A0ABD2Q237_9PLAT